MVRLHDQGAELACRGCPGQIWDNLNIKIVIIVDCVCVCVLVTQLCPTLQLHGLKPARLLCPRDSPGKNTGVGSHSHFFKGLPRPRDRTQVSGIAGRFFII